MIAYLPGQADVDQAPTFPEVMERFQQFLYKHRIYDPRMKKPLVNYAWCCDGPWDLRDFFM
jgi:3'-5' exoribonuclease 1